MKKIEAIIRPEKVEVVCSVLESIGYPGIMVTEIEGHGKQKGLTQQWRGKEYKVNLLPKIKIEVVIKDEHLERTIKAIREAAYTGEIGNGKIFVLPVEDVIRIRTNERGNTAV